MRTSAIASASGRRLAGLVLASAVCLPALLPSAPVGAQEKPKEKSPASRYPLKYPPTLPDGKPSVTEQAPAFLTPKANLKEGVAIAKAPPAVDFLYYPEQNYPGNPWSHRSDGIVVGDKYYSSSNDHLAPRGTALLWEYDAPTKKFRLLCDTT